MKSKIGACIVLFVCLVSLLSFIAEPARASGQYTLCYQPPRLNLGGQGRVALYPSLPNRVRSAPGFTSTVMGYIPAGGVFSVVNGPVCNGFSNWWQVNYNGLIGWTAEGDGGLNYWLEPVGYIPPPPPPPTCTLPNRLYVGGQGRVTPGLPNTVRTGPGITGTTRVGYIPGGGLFNVLGGPQCGSDGRWWWQVNYNGLVGWTAEGSGSTYWLEPANYVPPTPIAAACVLPNRLAVGGQGRVTPGTPNVVRSAPGTNASGSSSVVIGSIPGGGVFTVLSGPQCGTDGRWWWQANYNGLIGWTAEGEGYSNYWVEPWAVTTICDGFLPSRLTVGGTGRVTLVPPLPNTMRNGTSYGSAAIGQIPAGGVFTVLSGPICTENTAWWQVNYNGLIGWTSEGSSGTYYLEPY